MDDPHDGRVIRFTQLSVGFQIFLVCILIGSCSGGSASVDDNSTESQSLQELQSLQNEVRGLREEVEGLRRSSP